VSLGIGGIYPKLLNRLKESCNKFKVECRLWNGYPPNARIHLQSPYGFKIHVIQDAIREGYEVIIWADSACYIVKEPSPFFQMVKDKGILFLGHGDRLHPYVNDKSLQLFGIKREILKKHWMISGSLFGFDFSHNRARKFFDEYKDYEKNDWFREDEQKPGGDFLTHRHDEAIISLMLIKYKVDIPNAYDYFQGQGENVMFRAGKDI